MSVKSFKGYFKGDFNGRFSPLTSVTPNTPKGFDSLK